MPESGVWVCARAPAVVVLDDLDAIAPAPSGGGGGAAAGICTRLRHKPAEHRGDAARLTVSAAAAATRR